MIDLAALWLRALQLAHRWILRANWPTHL